MGTPSWAERYTRAMDDLIRVPGTKIGVGLDGLIGLFVPGAGDALTGVGSVALLILALRQGVPTVVIARMVMNVGLDALLGMFPVLGDVFDFFWKANRKNLELIEEYRETSGKPPGFIDYAFVGIGVLLALLAIVLPLVVTVVWGTVIARFLLKG